MGRRSAMLALDATETRSGSLAIATPHAAEHAHPHDARCPIEAAEAGQDLGLPTATGGGTSAIGTALASAPPEAAPVTDQCFPVLAVPPAVIEELQASEEGYAALRRALAPLAAANPQINQALDATGAAMIGATPVHEVVQPFDTTMMQVGQFLIALEEK